MPINFPSSPTTGQVYEYQSIRWRWNGSAWDKYEVFTFNGLTANVEGVGSYNGHTGAVQGVSSWNGQTGTVNFYNYVFSYNGHTGAVQGVSSWNGQTGTVNFYNYVSSYNGHTGAVQGVSSFGGRTGTVGAGITTGQILYWMNNDVAGSNNFTFDGTDIVTLAETGHYSGRLLGPVLVPIKNTGLTLINMGDPVYAVGSVGNSGVVEVFRADAAASDKMPAIGLADSSLAHNATGHAVVFGNLKLVDTSAYTINGTVFVAPGGGLTGIKPTGANDLIQNIGRVIRVNQSTGDILVSAIGRSNDVPNIVQVRSWLQMPDGMTATGLVKSFNGLTGAITGVTQINAGTGIAITGTTNPTVTNTGVLSVNGSTGAVSGVNSVNGLTGTLTISGGTGMSVLSGGKGITLVNTGVLSIDGGTGAITNVARTNVDNNFSTSQTVTNGMNLTTYGLNEIYFYDDISGSETFLYPSTATGTQTVTLPGGVNTTLAGLATTQTFTGVNTFNTLTTFNAGITAAGATFAGLATFLRGITASGLTVAGNGLVTGSFEVDGSLILPNGQTITGVVSSLNGLTGDLSVLASTGISVAAGGKGITLTNTGVQSFNGLTGAVSGVTTSVANTFTALQTFNAGITSAGATFTGNVAMNSTSSHTGLATFAGGITASGITVNGPIVASGLGTFTAGITSSTTITAMNSIWMPAGNFQLGGSALINGSGSVYYNPGAERFYIFGFSDINNSYNYQAARSPLRLNVGPNQTSNILGAYVQTAQGTQLSSTTDSTNLKSGIDNKGVIFSYVGLTASGATFTGNVAITSTSSHTGLASFAGGITTSNLSVSGYTLTVGNGLTFNNLAIGSTLTAPSLTTGYNNLVIGNNSGNALTTGYNNVILGVGSGRGIVSGYENMIIGSNSYLSGTGNGNVGVGVSTMRDAGNANQNTAIGYQSNFRITTATNNVGIGYNSILNNTTGSYNIGIGSNILYNLNGGAENTAVGDSALYRLTLGSFNAAVGLNALYNLTGTQAVSRYNTALGYQAGYYAGLVANGATLSSATKGVYVGYNSSGTVGADREIVIGAEAVGAGSNTTVIGTTASTSATIYGVINAPSGISSSAAITGPSYNFTDGSVQVTKTPDFLLFAQGII